MATDTQIAQILQIIANSKLFSELTEQTVLTDDGFFASINTGTEDAKKIKIPLLRGFSGDWNADTNTPNLSNGSGVSGTVYKINVAGSQDLGNGTVDYVVDQLIYYNSSQWVKLSQSKISDITGLREELDTLQENIDAEAITRGDADTTLQTNINNVEQSLEDNVQAEQDARIAEDIVLQENIDTESTTRSDADVALQGNIDAEASTRQSSDTTLQSNIDLKIDISSIVNNVTTGGSSVPLSAEQGKVLKAEILALAGSLIPQGNWDADTNTPDISGTTETGYFWIVSVSGSTDIGGITDWKSNDWVIKTSSGWAKIDNTDKVISVAGRIGEVVLDIADVTSLQNALNAKANLTGGNTYTGEQVYNNSSSLRGIKVENSSVGIGIQVLNRSSGDAINAFNEGAGNSIFSNNTGSGNGIVSQSSTTGTTGFNFVGADINGNTFTVDKDGNIIGLSFSGDGSALTNMPVSSAQQTALDLKLNKNNSIAGATKTKITYDTKGLVTGGEDATTNDISESTNKKYVTDAQLTILGNTSNTNSGDNSVNSSSASSAQGDKADSASQATGVENNADVTDATNVESSGALMDSEITNLAQVKAFDSSDYATSADLDLKANKASPVFSGNATFGGNVGIGTSAPDTTLQVVNTDSTQNILSLSNQNSLDVAFDFGRVVSSGSLSIQGRQTGFNNILLAPISGNVGIGTSVPELNLDVRGSSASDSGRLVVQNSNGSAFTQLYSGHSGDNPWFGWKTGTDLRFAVSTNLAGSGFSEKMRIKSNGDFDFRSGNATFGGQITSSENLVMNKSGVFSSELRFQNNTHAMGIDYQNNETLRFITRSGVTTVPITIGMRTGNIATIGGATFGGDVFIDSSTPLKFKGNGNETIQLYTENTRYGLYNETQTRYDLKIDYTTGNATFAGSVTAEKYYEDYEVRIGPSTLSNDDHYLKMDLAANMNLTIPTGLNKQVWEIIVRGSGCTLVPSSGVSISIVHNGQPNNLVISGQHSAKLIQSSPNQYILIKY